jgi:hypothetical protein
MKDIIQISFSVKVEASPLAKGLTEPITKIVSKAIPYLERVADAYVKKIEKETNIEETK